MSKYRYVAAMLALALSTVYAGSALTESPQQDGPDEHLDRRDARRLLDSFDDEPTVREVQRAALDHAGLDAETPKKWAGRARLSNLVPEIDGDVAWLDQRDRELEYDEDFERDGNDELHRNSAEHAFAEDERLRRKYSIGAELELGGLIFDRDEIYAARELRQQQATRRKLLSTVSELYYERRMKQVLQIVTPDRNWQKRLELAVAVERFTAQLDGLTGGWFRRQLDDST
jgi:hypothetical protein